MACQLVQTDTIADIANQDLGLNAKRDFIQPSITLRMAKCFRESADILLRGLTYFPDNKALLEALAEVPGSQSVLLELGQTSLEKGDQKKAAEYFEIVLLINPDDPSVRLELTRIQKEKKRLEVKKRLEELGTKPGEYLKLAKMLEAEEDTEGAIELLHEAELFFPKDVNLLFYLGKLYLDQGKAEKAGEYCEVILLNHSNSKRAASLLEKIKKKEKEMKREELEEALRQDPENLSILIALAKMQYGTSDLDSAYNYYDDYLFDDPDFEATDRLLDEIDSDNGNEPVDLPPMQTLPNKRNHQVSVTILGPANGLRDQQRHDEAVELLLEGLEKYPNDKFILNKLGHIYREQGKLTKAKKCAMESLFQYPFDAYPLTLLGQVSLDEGNRAKARKCFLKVLTFKPADAMALYFLGKMAVDNDNLLKAKRYLSAALRSYPDNRNIQNLLDDVDAHLSYC